jgi:hypothetical protein
MEKTIILFFCMLVAFSGFSKTTNSRDIHLHARNSDQEALRSILPIKAVLDGNTIQIEFFNSPENVVVKIKEATGKEVFTYIYSSPRLVQIPINQGPDDYVVEVIYGETCLYGNFTIGDM